MWRPEEVTLSEPEPVPVMPRVAAASHDQARDAAAAAVSEVRNKIFWWECRFAGLRIWVGVADPEEGGWGFEGWPGAVADRRRMCFGQGGVERRCGSDVGHGWRWPAVRPVPAVGKMWCLVVRWWWVMVSFLLSGVAVAVLSLAMAGLLPLPSPFPF
jgi:hypothetical protein